MIDKLQELSHFLGRQLNKLKNKNDSRYIDFLDDNAFLADHTFKNPIEEEDDWNAELYCFGNGSL